MNTKPGRNDACHCGSGKKYKVCHGLSSTKPYIQWTLIGVLVLAALWFFFYESEPAITPHRTSSPAPPDVGLLSLQNAQDSFSSPSPTSTAPAPPGKVWSVEHGHWHDASSLPTSATSNTIPKKPNSKPPGEAPPGKVWSPEHGHWHDKQ